MENVQDSLNRAETVPDGPLKVAVLEEAVRAADVMGEVRWQFLARQRLIDAAFAAGEAGKLFVALSWCLGKSADNRDVVDWDELLWQCQYALSYVAGFPSVTQVQMEQLSKDVLFRYRQQGASLRGPLGFIVLCHIELGQVDSARDYHERWRNAPIDEFSGMEEAHAFLDSAFQAADGNDDKALQIAAPYLDNPPLAHELFPWFAEMFLTDIFLRGDLSRAARIYRQSYRMCADNPKMLGHIAPTSHYWL